MMQPPFFMLLANALIAGGLASSTFQIQTEAATECQIDTTGPLCLEDQVLLPPALPDGLVGYWTFDSHSPRDISGTSAHGAAPVTAGPPFAGQGNSAFFHGSYLEIPALPKLSFLRDFTFSFWLFLVKDNSARQHSPVCPVLQKGMGQNRAPGVLYDRTSGQLRVAVATEFLENGRIGESGVTTVEEFESNARLQSGRWYHVALVRLDGQQRLRLYVNGVLDATFATRGFSFITDEPIYVGGNPNSVHNCNLALYIDELKVYNRPVSPDHLQAEAFLSLSGVEASYVRLACIDCTMERATENCPAGYDICDTLELHMGGYQVARTLGWLSGPNLHKHVWSRKGSTNVALQSFLEPQGASSQVATPLATPAGLELGIGLCCKTAERAASSL